MARGIRNSLKLWVVAAILAIIWGCADNTIMSEQAKAGKAAFERQCKICHQIGVYSTAGPDLVGVVGRQAGAFEWYGYSNALKDSGYAWTPEKLDVFLKSPQSAVPGTVMGFFGIEDPQNRAALIAYLDYLGK